MSTTKSRMIVTILLMSFFVQTSVFIFSKSSTWDETHAFGLGKYLLQQHRWDVQGAIIHPPLSYYLGSIPLLFFKYDESLWQAKLDNTEIKLLGTADVVRGQQILSLPENKDDRLLILSRLMFALLGVALGYSVYCFSRSLYGTTGGLVSLFFYSFCPNIIAFSGLTVPDLPLTAFTFMFIFFLWRSTKKQEKSNAIWAGIFLGLALLSKLTALLLLPIALFLSVLQAKNRWYKGLANSLVVCCLAVVVLLVGYVFDLTPYYQGLQLQLNNTDSTDAFLMGANSTGWWYYYPVAFMIKSPLPVIILFGVSLAIMAKKREDDLRTGLFLIVPIIVFVTIFCILPKCSGIRYILPVYPFIYVLIGSLATLGNNYRKLVYALGIWSVASAFYIAPHYMSYFNELIGGPGNGYKYLVDSNIDWGQELKGLKKYMDKNGIERVSLSYFGTDSPQRYGIQYDWLPSFFLYNQSPEKEVDVFRNRYLAISATNLQGTQLEDKNMFKWLMQYEPVAKIGYSIFIYDLAAVIKSQ